MKKIKEISENHAAHLYDIGHIKSEFNYSLTKESVEFGCIAALSFIKEQCQKWQVDLELMSKVFEENQMQSSLMSSQAMAQAYWNIIQLIDVNFFSTEP